MTLEELGAYLQETINDHSRIILPGMGMLYSKENAPQFIKNGNALTPPSRKLFFTTIVDSPSPTPASIPNEKGSAGGLDPDLNPVALKYASERKTEYDQACSELEELCRNAYTMLENQAYLTIPDFGTIRYGSGLDFVFEPHPGLECNIQNWGLDIICARKMQASRTAGKQPKVQWSKVAETRKKDFKDKDNKHRTLQIAVLVILVSFLLFVAAMFMFKDTFMPLWEKLLYTEEELQYLNSIR